MTDSVHAAQPATSAKAHITLGHESDRRAELTRLLYRGSCVSLILMLLTGPVFLATLWRIHDGTELFVWSGWIVLLALLRLQQIKAFDKAATVDQGRQSWLQGFLLGNVATALTLGYAMVALVPAAEFFEQALLYGVIGSVVVSAGVANGVSLKAFFSFAVPCLLPAAVILLGSSQPLEQGWGILALVVLFTLSLITWQINRLITVSLHQRSENRQLIARLERLRANAEKLNTELSREIDQRRQAEERLQNAYDGLEQRVAERTLELGRFADELRESEARLSVALEASQLRLWDWDVPHGEVYLSRVRSGNGIDGYERLKLDVQMRPVVHPEDSARVRQAMVAHLKGETEVYAVEYRALQPDGSCFWVEDRGRVTERGNDNRALRMIGTRRDVSEARRQAEQQRLATTVFEAAGEGMAIMDAEYRVLAINDACCVLSGYARDELVGYRAMRLANSSESRQQYATIHETLTRTGSWQGELIETRKNGEVYPQWVQLRLVRGADGSASNIVAFISDLSMRRQVEERLRYLTHYDELTGLANRGLLKERLHAACERARHNNRGLAVIYIDLDRFKLLNESLGHEAADQLLSEISRRLVHTVSEADTIARLSGDEFVVLLDGYGSLSSLAQSGSRLLSRISKPMTVGGQELVISASIGVSIMPDNAREGSVLLMQANMAMRHAKHLGGNTLQFFTEHLRASSLETLKLENQLRHALEEGQLEVFYQPRLSLADGRLEAAEALVRWRHPEQGLIAPGFFIPLAEETGLIIPLGEFVLRQACWQARQWQLDGVATVRVSVNLSVKQLRQGNFVSLVRQVLEETGLPPAMLELELTESQLLDNVDNAITISRQLRALGVKLAIDDFGTGYSSLSYLKRFPVDYVKIDRSFISELEQCGEDAAIVRAIIAMVHSLELKVVAEGVETQAQLDFLKAHHCDEIQGYLISRPVPAERFVQLLP